jgi:hypothetical protein
VIPDRGHGAQHLLVVRDLKQARAYTAMSLEPSCTGNTALPSSRASSGPGSSRLPAGNPPRHARRHPRTPASRSCGCQMVGHLMRPAHTHGSAHRVDLAARTSRPAGREMVRPARAAVPGPTRGAGGDRCNAQRTRPLQPAAADLPRSASDPAADALRCQPPLCVGIDGVLDGAPHATDRPRALGGRRAPDSSTGARAGARIFR